MPFAGGAAAVGGDGFVAAVDGVADGGVVAGADGNYWS